MKFLKRIGSWSWRVAAAGAVHAIGSVLGSTVLATLGVDPPRSLQPDATSGLLLLLPGGMVIALGLAAMAIGLHGRPWRRWAILGSFAFVVNGLGTAIETSYFTNVGGGPFLTLASLVASILCALVVAKLFPAPSDREVSGAAGSFVGWSPGRLVLALLAFPFFYFLFGMMIAPIVVPVYEQLDWAFVPPLSTLLPVLLVRGTLFLLVSIPVVALWGRSRGQLAFALAAGHFTAVGLSGLVQATFMPPILRWTHGVEMLATSICYGIALAWLLYARPMEPHHAVVAGDSAPP